MIIMLLFPPFMFRVSEITYHAGYGFIFLPLKHHAVDSGLLLAQWLIVGTVGIIGWYILKSDK